MEQDASHTHAAAQTAGDTYAHGNPMAARSPEGPRLLQRLLRGVLAVFRTRQRTQSGLYLPLVHLDHHD